MGKGRSLRPVLQTQGEAGRGVPTKHLLQMVANNQRQELECTAAGFKAN